MPGTTPELRSDPPVLDAERARSFGLLGGLQQLARDVDPKDVCATTGKLTADAAVPAGDVEDRQSGGLANRVE